ncbi:MAG: class I SAM-dependent methyltransferase [Snowella sp.]|nr:class I SAM-dependent methyltransferase [Snowella sp.]
MVSASPLSDGRVKNLSTLEEVIQNQIQASPEKRITFAEFMELALYHPTEGYYSSGKVGIGKAGDFFTSVSLGADFGELLAEQLAEIASVLNSPQPFQVIEMGAGLGNLANDILSYWQVNYFDLFSTIEYSIVEESTALIEKQKELLKPWLDKGIPINWNSWSDIDDDSMTGCFFSNELVDAFPVHQVIWKENKLQEIYVSESSGQWVEVIDGLSTLKILDYFQNLNIDFNTDNYPEGYRTEVNLQALDWLKTVNKKLKQGYLLTIDYGYLATQYYHPQRSQGTLQCYYQHRLHSDPYVNVGLQDLTAHVDFTTLENYGKSLGLDKLAFTQQGLFLMSLGLGDRLVDLSSGKYNILEIMQRRDALHQLIDPRGLGKFGVLLQAKGLTPEQKARSLKGFTAPQ